MVSDKALGTISYTVVLILCLSFVVPSQSVSVWEDITLTDKEKHALEKFKVLMKDKVPHGYMKSDIYLIKWLRSQNLDMRRAERALLQHLKWRKVNGMDTIAEEDFGDIAYEFPYSTDGIDYEGRPVLAVDTENWDIRRGLLQGKRDQMVRWAFRAYELGVRRIREMQSEGHNVTQFVMVCNFAGFNLVQHGCVEFLVNFLSTYEANYPGMADKIIGIKAPQSFNFIFQALLTVMTKETQAAVRLWGPAKSEWKINILKYIPKDQLDETFGGTRNRYWDK